jgi:hypothetical protein
VASVVGIMAHQLLQVLYTNSYIFFCLLTKRERDVRVQFVSQSVSQSVSCEYSKLNCKEIFNKLHW